MEKMIKSFEYKGVKYEIRAIQKPDSSWFLKDFLNGSPFSPFYRTIQKDINLTKLENLIGTPIEKYLLQGVEDDIKFWVDNKDKLNPQL